MPHSSASPAFTSFLQFRVVNNKVSLVSDAIKLKHVSRMMKLRDRAGIEDNDLPPFINKALLEQTQPSISDVFADLQVPLEERL